MTKSLLKNTFREIKNSKARFISIMAIIALGVGFFAGIKATVPSMYDLAINYCDNQSLMDYRLLSTTGFSEDDIKAVKNIKGVTSVMPSYFCDVQTSSDRGGEVVRLIALPTSYKNNEKLNKLVLKEGRLPNKKGEIVTDAGSFKKDGYKIGDKITISKKVGDTDVTTQLETFEYTVVGTVQSPVYISYQRGSTTVGNGKIADYMYINSDNFAFERYTELFVKTEASDKYKVFSDEYSSAIKKMTEDFETIADERCMVFETDVIEKAKNDLSSAKKDYNKEKNEADKKLADAKSKLEKSKADLDNQISNAQAELDNASSKISSSKNSLAQSKTEYYAQIDSAEKTIAKNEAELKQAKSDYNSSKENYDKQISEGQSQLDEGYEKYNNAYNEFKAVQEPQLLAGIAQAQSSIDSLQAAIDSTTDPSTLAMLNTKLYQAQSSLDNLNRQYDNAKQALSQNKAELDSKQQELNAQKEEGKKQLDEALKKINDGEKQLASAKTELKLKKSEGYGKLNAAQQKIDSAQAQYNSGVSKLNSQRAEGKTKLDSAQKQYDDNKSEADKKFDNAKKDIDEAQKKVDDLKSSKWYIYNRNDNPGFETFSQNADRLNAVATVFPLFFLLVAVLVCVTTMTRLIEEKRTEIGTIKALGYSNFSIIIKFVIYSLIAAVFGGISGVLIGVNTIPYIIYNAYKIMYYIGDISLIPDYTCIILGIIAAVLCTTSVSVIVCLRSLNQKLASLMRPKAPKIGKRIILEKIKPLWKHMSFNSKLTARNLLRYKSRLFMTVIGVAGCTALIVAAFGLLNSFDPLTHDQFEDIYEYNAVIIPKESGTQEQLKYLSDKVSSNKNVSVSMLAFQEECSISYKNNTKDADSYISVIQNPQRLDEIISLHTRNDKTKLELSDDGIHISEKITEEFNIKKGDTITIKSDSGKVRVKVCGIFEQYIHNYVYMTPKLYKELYQKEAVYNMLDVKLSDTSDKAKDKFSSDILSDEKIVAVNYIDASLEDLRNMLNSLNMVVMVMIICAAALAFVVLYNLTNINIAERVREIATFKVLGFNNKETSSFIYKENIILTILGIGAGLVMGIFLTRFIVNTVEVDNIMFGRNIYFTSYLYAAGLTMIFSLLVNAVMSFKIKAVDMVESLKSVE